ncbi:MAG: thioredoxin family protein, partial [Planctomycetota bacterium]|nr:thioredoxin family protein [Planctomycetota bacterium]
MKTLGQIASAVAVLILFLAFLPVLPAQIHDDLTGPLADANREGKLLLVDFYGDWCPWCVKMDESFEDAGVKELMKSGFHYFKLDVGQFDKHQDCCKQYSVEGIPFIAVFDPAGEVIATNGGYLDAANLTTFLKDALGKSGGKKEGKDEGRTVHPDIKNAFDEATRAGKLLLVDFYGDWCPWCTKMDETFENADVKELMTNFFHYVKLDVGKFERHKECMSYYGVEGLPHVIVLRPDGEIVMSQAGYAPVDEFKANLWRAVEDVAKWLESEMGIHPDLEESLEKANAENKLLLVDFYGDWCPWCVKMDETMADEDVKEMVARGFYYVKLDVGKFERHQECTSTYGVDGIPHWMVFDSDGTVLASKGGYMTPDDFKTFLLDATSKSGKKQAACPVFQMSDFEGADDAITAAVNKAKAMDRLVVIHFFREGNEADDGMKGVFADKSVAGAMSSSFAFFPVD